MRQSWEGGKVLIETSVVNVDSYYRTTRGYAVEERLLRSLGAKLVLATARSEVEVIAACRGATIVLVEHADTAFSARVMDSLDRCRMIARYGIGVDNIDLGAATERGVIVSHAPRYCVEEVSDHAAALLLNAARRVAIADRLVHDGGWHASFDPPIRRLSTQVLGLLGYGRIARRLAEKMRSFGFRIQSHDPYVPAQDMLEAGTEPVSFRELLRSSDFLSLHAPLTAGTRHLLGEAEFLQMKPTAWIVNTSRGALIEEEALSAAIAKGAIAGAALDVTEAEPLADSSPLRTMKNVILTAHQAALSTESLVDLRRTIAVAIEAVVRGYWPEYVANPNVIPRKPLTPWSEFLALPDRMTEGGWEKLLS